MVIRALAAGRPEYGLRISDALERALVHDEVVFRLRARCHAALGDVPAAVSDLMSARPSRSPRRVYRGEAAKERLWYVLGILLDAPALQDVRIDVEQRLHIGQASAARRLATDWAQAQEALEAGRTWARLARLREGQAHPALGAAYSKEARRRASELLREARYAEASDLLRAALSEPGGFSPRSLLMLAAAERAQSRYQAASNILAFAHVGKRNTAEALMQEAEVAWIEHQYPEGKLRVTRALELWPEVPRGKVVLSRCESPMTRFPEASERCDGRVLAHAAFHAERGGNFGDIVLPIAVQKVIERQTAVGGWLPVHVHQRVDHVRLDLINATSGILVGGGGLFLPDTSPNGESGWQWNISVSALKGLKVPLGVFAVGYNLFPGQEFQGSLFRRSLEALVERANLVGLRNRGSVDKVRDLLPPPLAEKVSFVPCPTTVLSHLWERAHPWERGSARDCRSGSGIVLLNAAFDRSERRFGDGYPAFLAQMRDVIALLRARGAEVRYASHLPSDERFVRDVQQAHGVELAVDRLYDMAIETAYNVYSEASLVIGMRGHAGMIPFGLGTPIISLVSHPKLRYFLEDIDRPEWGIDVSAPNLGGALFERASDILGREEAVREDIQRLQEGLLDVIHRETNKFLDVL